MRRILGCCLVAGLVGVLGGSPAAQAMAVKALPTDQVTAVTAAASISPTPVRGTDGRVHLAYELLLTNFAPAPATLVSVAALDGDHPSRVLDSLSGTALTDHFKVPAIGGGPASAAVMGPGQAGIVWIDATVGSMPEVPSRLLHRMRVTFPGPQSGGLIPADVTVTVAPTPVSPLPTPVVRSPLAGAGWFDANGCCDIVSSHRGAVNPLDGRVNFPERTAIDFIRIDHEGFLFTGDPTKLASYAYYGSPVHAAADGQVVAVLDGLPNQVPSVTPPLGSLPLADFAGNHVIEEFDYDGHFFYALYAHLEPGSVRVHVGQYLTAGQQIGLLGNSGNSSAPHLHFQVMDVPSALTSQGLPYEFDDMDLRGRAGSETTVDNLLAGKPFDFAPGVTPGERDVHMPLNLDLVDFPEADARSW